MQLSGEHTRDRDTKGFRRGRNCINISPAREGRKGGRQRGKHNIFNA